MNSGLLSQPARLGGILGIGFLVLFIVCIALQGDAPMANESVDDIRSFYVDNQDQYLITDFVTGIALLFLFLPFAACLQSILARAEGDPGICSRLVLAGAIVTLAVGGAASISAGALAMGASDEALDDSSFKLMAYASDYGFASLGFGFALTALSAGIVMASTGAVAKWAGYLGLLAAVLNVIGPAWVIDGDPEGALGFIAVIGYLVFAIWILATSIMLLRQPQASAVTMEPAAA
jgi:hypothetical protein